MTKGTVKWLENRVLRRGFTIIWSYPKHARQMGIEDVGSIRYPVINYS